MHKVSLKQGTLAWEKARETRIGSSEVFDLVRYYASHEELQNCGLNAEAVQKEKPYTTAWALYHKLVGDGIFQREALPPELAEYGHAVEPYGASVLQEGRKRRLKQGVVFLDETCIASLDVSGVSEEVDCRPFDYGVGLVPTGKPFVCEQKSMMPNVLKNGLPIKHIIQAQYQISKTKHAFYLLQLMVLNRDTVFERGKITQMSPKKRRAYLQDNMQITHLYFQDNAHLAMLIQTCLQRFFEDVCSRKEPTPFLETDSQRNILDSIRINSFFNKDLVLAYDLGDYTQKKAVAEAADCARKKSLQAIIEAAKKHGASRFRDEDGTVASFSSDGKFLLKPPRA